MCTESVSKQNIVGGVGLPTHSTWMLVGTGPRKRREMERWRFRVEREDRDSVDSDLSPLSGVAAGGDRARVVRGTRRQTKVRANER